MYDVDAYCSKDNFNWLGSHHCSVRLGTWHGNSKSTDSGEILIPQTNPHPYKQGRNSTQKNVKPMFHY